MTSRRIENAEADGVRHHRMKRSTVSRVISGNISLTDADADVQVIDQGGTTRVVTLPAATDANEGRSYLIKAENVANNLTINNAAASTLATATPGEWVMAIQVRGTWHAIAIAPS